MNIKNHPPSYERGSAFFTIIIAVALFAALTYAVSRMDNASNNLSTERLRVTAGEMIDQADKFSDAVARMRLQGATPTQLSFSNTVTAGYTNAACVTDACLFFAANGGGMEWQTAPPTANQGENWGFTGNVSVKNIGTDQADLMAILPHLSIGLCKTINERLGQALATATPVTVAAITASKFTGIYNLTPNVITGVGLDGKISGCLEISTLDGTAIDGAPIATSYTYYHVLLAQ